MFIIENELGVPIVDLLKKQRQSKSLRILWCFMYWSILKYIKFYKISWNIKIPITLKLVKNFLRTTLLQLQFEYYKIGTEFYCTSGAKKLKTAQMMG